jgi:hypothetical protein
VPRSICCNLQRSIRCRERAESVRTPHPQSFSSRRRCPWASISAVSLLSWSSLDRPDRSFVAPRAPLLSDSHATTLRTLRCGVRMIVTSTSSQGTAANLGSTTSVRSSTNAPSLRAVASLAPSRKWASRSVTMTSARRMRAPRVLLRGAPRLASNVASWTCGEAPRRCRAIWRPTKPSAHNPSGLLFGSINPVMPRHRGGPPPPKRCGQRYALSP